MSNKIDKALILNKIKDELHFKKDIDFAKFLGIPPQTLSSWYTRNRFDIEILYSKCVGLNAAFLITGEGPVLKNDISINQDDQIEDSGAKIFKLKTDTIVKEQSVPLYNIEASAGIVGLFASANDIKPVDYISIPNLPRCDGALYVSGDSMYPLLKSGDIIMYKEVHNITDNIFWGEMYLVSLDVEGEEFIAVKYIQKSDEGIKYVKLVSQNSHHQPKDILVANIRALAMVKASIRINSMY